MAMLSFPLLTAALVSILVNSSKGLAYHCTTGNVVAYTPTGTFQRSTSGVPNASCTLQIPKRLFRSSTSKLKVNIQYINTGTRSTCDAEYLFIAGRKYCDGTASFNLLSTDGDFISISYNTTSSQTQTTFLLHYTVYTDVCDTIDIISGWPVILASTGTPSTTDSCATDLNITQFDKLVINAENTRGLNTCNYDDIVVKNTDKKICEGQECLNGEGLDISNFTTLKVVSTSQFGCMFYWKFTVFSENIVQDICSLTGSSLTLPQGKLSSPGYRKGYAGTLDCAVTISGFEAVSMTIMYYDLNRMLCGKTNPCDCGDRLVINETAKCGRYPRPSNRTYVGADVPVSVQLITLSASLSSSAGFYLTYKGYSNALDICNLPTDRELSLPVELKSPNFPNSYPSNKNCQASIDVSRVGRVRIQLIAFSMEDYGFHNHCPYDYLSIADKRYCGKKDGYVMEIDLNTVVLRFRSDDNKTSRGFYLSIEGVKLPTPDTLSVTSSTVSTTKGNSATPINAAPQTSASRSTGTQTTVSKTVTDTSPGSVKPSVPRTASDKPTRSVTVPPEGDQGQTISYNELTDRPAKIPSDPMVKYGIPYRETTSVQKSPQDNADTAGNKTCAVPWYYWICSLIAILLAVLITITICLIKLKRLKVAMNGQHYSDTESSRDGLTNPVYYNSSNNGGITHNGGNPYYTNIDRVPLGTRVVINKNSTQTTV